MTLPIDTTKGRHLYVPADDRAMTIRHASAIVGTPHGEGGMILVDYEGGRAENMATFADRVHFAWGRHAESYPTTARALLPADALIEVGRLVPTSGGHRPRILVDKPELLDAWAGEGTSEEVMRKISIGQVLVTESGLDNPYTYRGVFSIGAWRVKALQAFRDHEETTGLQLWHAPASGGARPIEPDEVNWETMRR